MSGHDRPEFGGARKCPASPPGAAVPGGDEQAFARLFERFGRRTLAHLRTLLGDAAEDVQQEVWLAVYRGIRTLGNPGAFSTWLFRTTRHRAIDFLRSRKRERELIEEASVVSVEASEPDEGTSFTALDETVLNAALANISRRTARSCCSGIKTSSVTPKSRSSSAVRSGRFEPGCTMRSDDCTNF